MRLPSIRSKVDAEMAKARKDIEDKLVRRGPTVVRHLSLPEEGQSPEWILEEMERMDVETGGTTGNTHWQTGKLSGAVYHGGKDLEVCQTPRTILWTLIKPLTPWCARKSLLPRTRSMLFPTLCIQTPSQVSPTARFAIRFTTQRDAFILAVRKMEAEVVAMCLRMYVGRIPVNGNGYSFCVT